MFYYFFVKMSCEVLIRFATSRDDRARADLIRTGIMSHQTEAFLLYFFQEVTLQCVVLCGAVLFIFCGVSVSLCLLVVPGAAAVVAAAVYVSHIALAEKHIQKMRSEMYGLVGEVLGPLLMSPQGANINIITEDDTTHKSSYSQVIGTVSVSELWGPQEGGWLHDLSVHPQWQRRGVGSALVTGATRNVGVRHNSEGVPTQWGSVPGASGGVHAVLSSVQHAARTLLHKHKWECVGSYTRQLGAGATLQLVHLATHAPTVQYALNVHVEQN